MKASLGKNPPRHINLSNIRIASPCSASWENMKGDDRVRHCLECNLNVYNFSAMTEREVQKLLAARNGRLCGRWYQRTDRSMLTQDCPIGLRASMRRISRVAGAALSAIMSVSSALAQNAAQRPPQRIVQTDQKDSGIALLVMDQTGAVIQNAKVSVSRESDGELLSRITDQEGRLRLTGIAAGFYVINVTARGFRSHEATVQVSDHATTDVHVVLLVGVETVIIEVYAPTLGVIDEVSTPVETNLQPVPDAPVPRSNIFKRLFSATAHKLGF